MMERSKLEFFFQKTARFGFIAAIAVLYSHASTDAQFGIGAADPAYSAEQKLISLLSWAVPYFFFLSAFLFFRNYAPSLLLQKWKRRLYSLAVPYLVWNTFYFILFAILPRVPVISGFIHTPAAPLTVNSILGGIFLHTYDGVMWFIRILILLTLAAPGLYYLLKFRIPGLITVLAMYAALLFRVPFPAVIPNLNWQSVFYYALGAYLSLHYAEFVLRPAPKRLALLCLCLLPAVCAWRWLTGTGFYPLLALALLFYGVDAFPLAPRPAHGTSFFVFASHILFLSFIKKILALVLPHTGGGMLLAYFLSPLLALPFIVGIALLVKKYAPNIWRVLSGNR